MVSPLSHFSTFAYCSTWFINYYPWIFFFFLICRHLFLSFWPFSPSRWNHILEPASWIIQDYKIHNPGHTTAINLYQHRWLLREKPSFRVANTSTSMCFAPLLTLLYCLNHPQKQQSEWMSGKLSPLKLSRTHYCSATAKPADQTPIILHYLIVTEGKPDELSFSRTSAKHPSLTWTKQRAKNWKGLPLPRNTTEDSRCGSVLHAGKILQLGTHTQGSTCWGLFGALLPKKTRESNQQFTRTRDFNMKVKTWGLAGLRAPSLERKHIKWNI